MDKAIVVRTGIWQPVLSLVVSLPNHLSKESPWSILYYDWEGDDSLAMRPYPHCAP
jgi:hypothetical protein